MGWNKPVFRIRIRDPVPFRPLDPGWVKTQESGSGMNNPDHISESLETVFLGVKIRKLFDADPGWKKFGFGMEKIWIRDPG